VVPDATVPELTPVAIVFAPTELIAVVLVIALLLPLPPEEATETTKTLLVSAATDVGVEFEPMVVVFAVVAINLRAVNINH